MINNIWSVSLGKLLIIFFVILTVFWVITQTYFPETIDLQELYADSYFVLALFGGFAGLIASQKWGSTKSIMGKACILFSLGLFAQAFGQMVYSYYALYLNMEVPYPSIGDIGFFGSIPLYLFAVFLLGKASGVKFSKQTFSQRLTAVCIPVVILILSSVFFLNDYDFSNKSKIEVFLDFAYPIGQASYLSLTITVYLLSNKLLGGIMRNKVLFVLVALIIQYLADIIFLYQATHGEWTAGGINDYIYTIAYFIMGLSLIKIKLAYDELSRN